MFQWMLSTMLATVLVAGAAWMAGEVARVIGWPRRSVWIVGLLLAAILPFLYVLLPGAPGSRPVQRAATPLELVTDRVAGPESAVLSPGMLDLGTRGELLLLAMWAAASGVLIAAFLFAYWRYARLRGEAERAQIDGLPALLTEGAGPMVVGFRRPEVLLPRWIRELPTAEQRLIVRHEHEHVRSGDSRLLIGVALLMVAMPWNLALWWMRRRLVDAIEVDCDARVIAAGADPRLYGLILIRLANRPLGWSSLAPAFAELPSLLERRILAMTEKRPRHRAGRVLGGACAATLLLIAACEVSPRGISNPVIGPEAGETSNPLVEPDAGEKLADEAPVQVDDIPSGNADSSSDTVNFEVLRVGRIQPDGEIIWDQGTTPRARRTPDGYRVVNGDSMPIYHVDIDLSAYLESSEDR